MTTILVPAWLPREPEPEVTEGAVAVLTDVRGAAAAVSDVASWAAANGAPGDWSGDAAEAADHAVTRFAGDTDAVAAALEKAALAVNRFLTAMARRRSEHVDLSERRTTLNQDREALLARIEASTEDDVAALRVEADRLQRRFDAYETDLVAWRDRIEADEDTAIAALRSVDTVTEGESAANDPARVDTAPLAAELQRLGGDTDAVNAWWSNLSQAERNALLINDPDLIGNTNGIPTGDRDEANRASVQRDIEYLLGLQAAGQELTHEQRRWLENAQSIEQAVANAGKLPYSTMDIDVNVMAYQPHAFGGDGIAAVSYGDPDTADHTAVYVPGIMQDGTTIDENGMDALALYEQSTLDGSSVATIAWIGYDSPNWNPDGSLLGYPDSAGDAGHTLTEANAEQGGHLLSDFVDGLNSTHEGGADDSHLTVIGHSYGSTTSAHAAADGLAADSLVLIGSPGAGGGVDHVSGLNMPEGQVYVGSADNDPVTWLGGKDGLLPGGFDDVVGLGEDPSQSDFGAHNFEVDPGREFEGADIGSVGLMDNHVSYFDETNPALGNMADVVTGHGDQVADTGGRTQDAHDYLYDWVGDEVDREVDEAYDEHVAPVVDTVTETYEDVEQGVRDVGVGLQEQWDNLPRPSFDDVWPDNWP